MAISLGNGKTMILIIAATVLGSVGAAVGTGIFLTNRNRAAAPAATKHEAPAEPVEKTPETIHPLGEMVVNLADSGDLRYVKIGVAVGIEEKLDEAAIKTYEPLLKDAVIQVVSHKHFNELRRPDGLEKLKKDLKEAMKGRVPKATVVQVYLEGFAMQ